MVLLPFARASARLINSRSTRPRNSSRTIRCSGTRGWRGRRRGAVDAFGQVGQGDLEFTGLGMGLGDHQHQFVDVSGPGVGVERVERVGGEAGELALAAGIDFLEEQLGQKRDVFATLGQRRQPDHQRAQRGGKVGQVFVASGQFAQRPARGSDQAQGKGAAGERAKGFRVDFARKEIDVVQQEGAAGSLGSEGVPVGRRSEGRLDQIGAEDGAGQRNQRPAGFRRTGIVDRFGHELTAASDRTGDEHTGTTVGGELDLGTGLADGGGFANEAVDAVADGKLFPVLANAVVQLGVFALSAVDGERFGFGEIQGVDKDNQSDQLVDPALQFDEPGRAPV